jgi:hypothetical protein
MPRAQHQHLLRREIAPTTIRPPSRDIGASSGNSPARIAHHLEGDRACALRRQRPRALGLAGQVVEREDRRPARHHGEVGVLHLLHLHDQVAIPDVLRDDDVGAARRGRPGREPDAGPGARLDAHVSAPATISSTASGSSATAPLALLGLARNPDDHRSARRALAIRSGPR